MASDERSGERDGKALRVLVIEDDAVALRKLEQVIAESGLETVCADGLEQAREKIHTLRVDAAILDVNLPDGDGLSLVPELHGSKHPVACVVLTGDVEDDVVRRAIGLGVTQFLRKPATPHQIRHAISMAVHRTRMYRSWLSQDEESRIADGSDLDPPTADPLRPRRSTYRVSVSADTPAEAVAIAREGLPRGTTVVSEAVDRDPDLDRWAVTLRFTKG